jgi:CubicO group peptidase (beta-lactamase class C family)
VRQQATQVSTVEPLARTQRALDAGRERGLHDAAQVHVRLADGADHLACVGTTAAGEPCDPRTLFSWTCASKPITALGIGRLVDDGVLDFDDPLARWLPESERWGRLTLTHLLTHSVPWYGDPGLRATITGADEAVAWLLANGEVDPSTAPGACARYSVWTGWLLLGEVIQRATGSPFEAWIGEHVLAPAGLRETTFSLTPGEYAARQPRLALLHHRHGDENPYVLDGEAVAGLWWPGSSARGPASDLSRLFEVLLLDALGTGPGLLTTATARRITSPVRVGLVDESTGVDHAWGLGVTTDRRAIHPKASAGVFCHAGISTSTLAFADPDLGVVAAMTTDGIPMGVGAAARRFAVAAAVYRDVLALRGGATR